MSQMLWAGTEFFTSSPSYCVPKFGPLSWQAVEGVVKETTRPSRSGAASL